MRWDSLWVSPKVCLASAGTAVCPPLSWDLRSAVPSLQGVCAHPSVCLSALSRPPELHPGPGLPISSSGTLPQSQSQQLAAQTLIRLVAMLSVWGTDPDKNPLSEASLERFWVVVGSVLPGAGLSH